MYINAHPIKVTGTGSKIKSYRHFMIIRDNSLILRVKIFPKYLQKLQIKFSIIYIMMLTPKVRP